MGLGIKNNKNNEKRNNNNNTTTNSGVCSRCNETVNCSSSVLYGHPNDSYTIARTKHGACELSQGVGLLPH